MSAARDTILGRVRQALAASPTPADPPGLPTSYRRRSDADVATRIADFSERAAGYKVRVERVPRDGAAAMAAQLLAERGHRRLAVPRDFPHDLMPAGVELVADDDLDTATIAGCDGVLSTSACAIAQTGTIVLDHGPGQGRRKLTLLPDYHLCFVLASTIVGLVPEAVERVAPAVRAGRPLTFISGPSATSDIELSRVEGVHGPRTLDVVIVEDGPAPG